MTVDALIVHSGKILLIKRSGPPFRNFWALPGGFVDKGETVEAAVLRETYEETNLKINRMKLLGIYSDPGRHPKQLIAACFIAETVGIPKPGDDAKDLAFFGLDNLPENIAFDHRNMISDYKNTPYESTRR